jgi:hypothetical protein
MIRTERIVAGYGDLVIPKEVSVRSWKRPDSHYCGAQRSGQVNAPESDHGTGETCFRKVHFDGLED